MTASRRHASEPTPGSLADVQDEADPHSVARSIVLRRLTAAPRTTKELADDLVERGIPAPVIDEVLTRFTEVGLLDDAAYAQMWVASRQRTRGTARPVLRQELRRKGVGEEHIATALAQVDDQAEADRARQLVEAQRSRVARLEPVARQRRLAGMLIRRGYAVGLAHRIVREALGDAHLDDVQIPD